jgi:hypothetical protein
LSSLGQEGTLPTDPDRAALRRGPTIPQRGTPFLLRIRTSLYHENEQNSIGRATCPAHEEDIIPQSSPLPRKMESTSASSSRYATRISAACSICRAKKRKVSPPPDFLLRPPACLPTLYRFKPSPLHLFTPNLCCPPFPLVWRMRLPQSPYPCYLLGHTHDLESGPFLLQSLDRPTQRIRPYLRIRAWLAAICTWRIYHGCQLRLEVRPPCYLIRSMATRSIPGSCLSCGPFAVDAGSSED